MHLRKYTVVISLLTLSTPHALAFSDTQNYWAKNCVQQLGERKLITGQATLMVVFAQKQQARRFFS